MGFRYVNFTDCHVNAASLSRVCEVLKRVRETVHEREATAAVCNGDFWDLRGTLSVRQLDVLLDEFEKFAEEEIDLVMIPGNHDQVTIDGRIHGVRVFDPFPNIYVATDPIMDEDDQTIFIPWREDPKEQSALFKQVPDGWTVFGHAEVAGAMTNEHHKTKGRVSRKTIVKRARACYLGHYHKRQKLADRIWYIGSPYEKNFGEREWPHGIAVVDSESIEPEFIDFEDFPHHFYLNFPDDAKKFSKPREQDIVKVFASHKDWNSPKLLKAMSKLKTPNVRMEPLDVEEDESAPPSFALDLHQALEHYVDEVAEDSHDELKRLGKSFLADVPDTGAIVPVGYEVMPVSVRAKNFCAIRGDVEMELEGLGAALLSGPMAIGKTSLCDAVNWCLFGTTTPRKAGSSGSTLNADEVINDAADETEVQVQVRVDEDAYTITRTKTRGKGAKLAIEGMDEGISDSQELVHRIVGVNYDLWRTCVYLGQGAVANFITDTDKKRKELLNRAFGLAACPEAQKLVKARLKEIANQTVPVRSELTDVMSRYEAWKEADFSAEAEQWEQRRQASIEESKRLINELKQRVESYDAHLATESQWEDVKTEYQEHIDKLTQKLAKSSASDRLSKLHSELGGARSEKGHIDAAIRDLHERYRKMQEAGGTNAVCETCGQQIDPQTHEQHLSELEAAIQAKQTEKENVDVRASNIYMKIQELQNSGDAQNSTVQRQLEEARQEYEKCVKGLNAIAKIKANRESAVEAWREAHNKAEEEKKAVNPFEAKQKERKQKLKELKSRRDELKLRIEEVESEERSLRFWEDGFSAKGLPVLVLRTALHEIETHANRFLGRILDGRIYVQLEMTDEDLKVRFFEMDQQTHETVERSYKQLSAGQRSCVEKAFSPFALSEMIFSRTGVRIPLLIFDELTTHMDPETKAQVCSTLNELDRESVLVIDHDAEVQGAFDVVFEASRDEMGCFDVRRVS